MKVYILITLSLVIVYNATAQTDETHNWKKLETINGEKMWYDISSIDTIKGDRFDIWVLQVHTPPLKSEGINGEVYRSKLLYSVNLTTVRYGIMKLRYYDVKNTEIYKFDYDTPPPPTDALRYPYPILEESPVYFIIGDLFGKKKKMGKQ